MDVRWPGPKAWWAPRCAGWERISQFGLALTTQLRLSRLPSVHNNCGAVYCLWRLFSTTCPWMSTPLRLWAVAEPRAHARPLRPPSHPMDSLLELVPRRDWFGILQARAGEPAERGGSSLPRRLALSPCSAARHCVRLPISDRRGRALSSTTIASGRGFFFSYVGSEAKVLESRLFFSPGSVLTGTQKVRTD